MPVLLERTCVLHLTDFWKLYAVCSLFTFLFFKAFVCAHPCLSSLSDWMLIHASGYQSDPMPTGSDDPYHHAVLQLKPPTSLTFGLSVLLSVLMLYAVMVISSGYGLIRLLRTLLPNTKTIINSDGSLPPCTCAGCTP